jgi:alanyl-tRNA synthetase
MTTNELRSAYLNFFKTKANHAIVPSAKVLPENDPTTLFTGSGMQPMVPFLLGESHPQGTRIADSQKCIRTQDIEEVGDNRHTTFFEMLGNWSLGDYFKQEQINWMFTFLVEELGLDANRLCFTCYAGNDELGIPRDTEAAELWQSLLKEQGIDAGIAENAEELGMQGARIFYYDDKKNWWSRAGVPANMPAGEPGGPDTEMFWDFGEALGLHEQSEWKDEPCHVNCDCGRFMEIGNNVFMQYQKTEDGFAELPQKNVDFGGGLERIAAAMINDPDVFMIDLFAGLRETLETLSGKTYGKDEEDTYAFRIVMDHLRASVFLIADGAPPSNKDQGYYTRRMLRRAVRYLDVLGIAPGACKQAAEAVIDTYQDAYPELTTQKETILSAIDTEETKFRATLAEGMKRFEALASETEAGGTLDAQGTFDLYQSFGFPLEMTIELAEERNIKVDEAAFEQAMQAHKDLSREASAAKFKGGLADHSEMSVKYHTATHLLHAALLEVLGPHATQKGSNITPERLRFDFNHTEALTPEQKTKVEELVNAAIQKDYQVTYQELSFDEAKAKGAIGLFEDKYQDVVKVYTIGDEDALPEASPLAETFSRELCGGPHVERTGVLGTFKIKKEKSCGAGVRRIKAILE